MAADDLALRAAGDDGPVGQEFDFPSTPVNADVMMELAQEQALGDAGGSTVLLVPDVVDVALRGAPVAASRPGAVLIPQDYGAADGLWDA